MRIVFMGTPEISVPAFRALAAEHEMLAAVCQPDKAVGRKQIMTAPPIKVAARELGIPVFQPQSLRKDNDFLFELKPDLIVVMAYGKILPANVLSLPKYGCVNLHASLLPKYRGSAPIQWAICRGETVTGITYMQMDEGIDTGDMLYKYSIPILAEDDAASMFEKIARLGGETVCTVVEKIAAGEAVPEKQRECDATKAPMISKEDGELSFTQMDAKSFVNLVRGFSIWPQAYFVFGDQQIKVTAASLSEGEGEPGEILSVKPLAVATGRGAVELMKVKPQGSREMTGFEFIAGRRLKKGDFLI